MAGECRRRSESRLAGPVLRAHAEYKGQLKCLTKRGTRFILERRKSSWTASHSSSPKQMSVVKVLTRISWWLLETSRCYQIFMAFLRMECTKSSGIFYRVMMPVSTTVRFSFLTEVLLQRLKGLEQYESDHKSRKNGHDQWCLRGLCLNGS